MKQLFIDALYQDGDSEQHFMAYVSELHWNARKGILKYVSVENEDELTEVTRLNVINSEGYPILDYAPSSQ